MLRREDLRDTDMNRNDEARANEICRGAIGEAKRVQAKLKMLDDRQQQASGLPKDEWLTVGEAFEPYARFWRPRHAEAFDAFVREAERVARLPYEQQRMQQPPQRHLKEACPPCAGAHCDQPGKFLTPSDTAAFCSLACSTSKKLAHLTMGR